MYIKVAYFKRRLRGDYIFDNSTFIFQSLLFLLFFFMSLILTEIIVEFDGDTPTI